MILYYIKLCNMESAPFEMGITVTLINPFTTKHDNRFTPDQIPVIGNEIRC